MKIRNGFVSNSSSSSFILKFDKVPETKEEMRVLLYGENPSVFTTHRGDDAISTEQVANIIFNDVVNASFFDINQLISSVKSEIGNFNEYNYDESFSFVEGTKYYQEFDKLYDEVMVFEKSVSNEKYKNGFNWKSYCDKLNKMSEPMFELIEKAIREKYNEDDSFMEVEYSDNDSEVFSYIEHGGVLDKITVQRFSHH